MAPPSDNRLTWLYDLWQDPDVQGVLACWSKQGANAGELCLSLYPYWAHHCTQEALREVLRGPLKAAQRRKIRQRLPGRLHRAAQDLELFRHISAFRTILDAIDAATPITPDMMPRWSVSEHAATSALRFLVHILADDWGITPTHRELQVILNCAFRTRDTSTGTVPGVVLTIDAIRKTRGRLDRNARPRSR